MQFLKKYTVCFSSFSAKLHPGPLSGLQVREGVCPGRRAEPSTRPRNGAPARGRVCGWQDAPRERQGGHGRRGPWLLGSLSENMSALVSKKKKHIHKKKPICSPGRDYRLGIWALSHHPDNLLLRQTPRPHPELAGSPFRPCPLLLLTALVLGNQTAVTVTENGWGAGW